MHARLAGLLLLAGTLSIQGAGGAAAAGLPVVSAAWATDVTASSARLNALVYPNGFSTSVRFEYIAATAYKANLEAGVDPFSGALKSPPGAAVPIGAGTAEQKVLRQLEGLKASTAYRYRLAATNSGGTALGPLRALSTEDSAPVFALPDGRGWEMVSPVDKNGGAIEGPGATFGGAVFQAAAQGGSLTYTSRSSFALAQGSPGASQYVARRSASGWSTENITLPLNSGGYGEEPDGVPYRLFSSDLARAVHLDARRCLELAPCPRGYSLRESAGGSLTSLLAAPDLRLAGATPDLAEIVLEGSDLYRWAAGVSHLVNVKPGESVGAPGATLAAAFGAISTDGSRVYWSLEGDLYLREGSQSVQVDEALGGGGAFEVASADGSIAYLTKGGHLYRFAAASKVITDLTPSGEVEGVLGASADGSRVYYLTSAGLFLRDGAATVAVAPAADASNYPPATGSARVSADGASLAFVSSAQIGEYDSDGRAEVYLYSLADGLTCASCNPTGERPLGSASIPGAIANGTFQAYKPRNLSADGSRLYFDSFDSLAPQDTNNDRDAYQWEAQGVGGCAKAGGCVNLISSGRSEDGASFIDASADGADVFFTTDGSLVPGDPGAVDIYDARMGGGLPVPPPPIPCNGDACQPLPGEPEDPAPGTLLARPEGNPPLSFPKQGKGKKKHGHKKHHRQRRHGVRR